MALNLMTPRYVAPDVTKASLAGESVADNRERTSLAKRAQQANERAQAIQAGQSNVRLEQEWQRINLSQAAQALSVAQAQQDMRHKEQMLPLQAAELENRVLSQDMNRRLTAASLARENQIINATPAFNDYMNDLNSWDGSQSVERPPTPPTDLPPELRAKADGAFASLRKIWLDRVDVENELKRREENNNKNRSLLSGQQILGGSFSGDAVNVNLGSTGGSTGSRGGYNTGDSTSSRSNLSGYRKLPPGAAYFGGGYQRQPVIGAEWDKTEAGHMKYADSQGSNKMKSENPAQYKKFDTPVKREAYALNETAKQHLPRFKDQQAALAHTLTAGTVGADVIGRQGNFPFWNQETDKMDEIVTPKLNERGEVVAPVTKEEKEWRRAGYNARPLAWEPPKGIDVDGQLYHALNAQIHPTLIDAINKHHPSSRVDDDGSLLKQEEILSRFMKDKLIQSAGDFDITDESALSLMKDFGDVMISEWEHSAAKGKDRWDVTEKDLDNYMGNVQWMIRAHLKAYGKPDAGKVALRGASENLGVASYDLKWSRGDDAVKIAKKIGLPLTKRLKDVNGHFRDVNLEEKIRAEGLPWSEDWTESDFEFSGTKRQGTAMGTHMDLPYKAKLPAKDWQRFALIVHAWRK